MKILVWTVVLAACFGLSLFVSALTGPVGTLSGQAKTPASDDDKAAVTQVIQAYLDVTDKKDYEAIKKAFHPSAKLMSVGKSGLREMSQEEWGQRVSRIPDQAKRTSKITMIDITGLAAVVRVDYDFHGSTDYLSLLKINGEWKIVNKTLSTQVR